MIDSLTGRMSARKQNKSNIINQISYLTESEKFYSWPTLPPGGEFYLPII